MCTDFTLLHIISPVDIYLYVFGLDAKRVINQSVDIEGTSVTPELVRDRRHRDVCAIRVDNISPDISHDMLKLIFESKSASGGGEIEDMFVDCDNMTAVITYLHLKGL